MCLQVVSHHAESRSQVMQRAHDALLDRVQVLVFVDNYVLDPLLQSTMKIAVFPQRRRSHIEDARVIDVGLALGEQSERRRPSATE